MRAGRWQWSEDQHRWIWTEQAQAEPQRVLQPSTGKPAPSGDFREHRTAAGPLWVPEGARLHDVPFGFQVNRREYVGEWADE